ncbi:MAG: RHS repeat domain-containing protein [Bacteroides sp.]
MSYKGNQLVEVDDRAPLYKISELTDFKNGVNEAIEYIYDQNGSLTKDSNKGLNFISYNSLHLPMSLDITNSFGSATNNYTYSVDSKKLKVEMKFGNQTKTTDYVGNMIYENGALKRILVDGGYVENGQYHFYIQDHLGNNRVVAKVDGTVIQTNYYPFGMTFMEDDTHDTKAQPYKYNGKEFDGERGLNVYDYSARYMDPALGRFMTVDPLSEKYYSISPYAYCGNNPVKYVDPELLKNQEFQVQTQRKQEACIIKLTMLLFRKICIKWTCYYKC